MENARRRCFILLFLRKNTLPLSFGVSPTAAFFYPSAKPPRFCGRIFFRKRKFWYVFFLRVSCRNALRLFTADFPQNPPRARTSAIFTEHAFPQTDSCAHLRRSAPFFLSDLKICSRRGVHAELFCVLFAYGIFFAQPRSGLRPAHVPAENLSAFSLGTLFHTAFFPILRNKRSGGNFPLRFKHPGNFGRLNSFAPLHVGPSDFPPR